MVPLPAFRILVIAEGCSTICDSSAENALDGIMQTIDLLSAKSINMSCRVDSRDEKRLIRINIADACDMFLLE